MRRINIRKLEDELNRHPAEQVLQAMPRAMAKAGLVVAWTRVCPNGCGARRHAYNPTTDERPEAPPVVTCSDCGAVMVEQS